MTFRVDVIPVLTDNYTFLVSDLDLGLAMVIDPADGDSVIKILRERDLYLSLILNTHHHKDHIGGNEKLVKEYGAPIIAPAAERDHIHHMDRGIAHGDTLTFSTLHGVVIGTPGHTRGHTSYYFPELRALFAGDALFSLGCGRLFEGTAADMWASLLILRSLPDDTLVYAAHEYTVANAEFALKLDPTNQALKTRALEAKALRTAGKPTIHSLLGVEKAANPFLRADHPDLHKNLARAGIALDTTPAAIFGAIRTAKDRFGQSLEA